MVNRLPYRLRMFIAPGNLTFVDCVELMQFAAEALKQCYQNDYSNIDFRTVAIHVRRTQKRFYGIRERDIADVSLSPEEWAELAQFAGEGYNSIDKEG